MFLCGVNFLGLLFPFLLIRVYCSLESSLVEMSSSFIHRNAVAGIVARPPEAFSATYFRPELEGMPSRSSLHQTYNCLFVASSWHACLTWLPFAAFELALVQCLAFLANFSMRLKHCYASFF